MDLFQKNITNRRAFTLIELIIVIGLMVAISLFVFPALFGRRNTADMQNTAQQIASLLRQAQNDSVSGKQGVSWGVHFENGTSTAPFYALFSSAYGATSTVAHYALPPTVGYVTSTLAAGSSLDIIFSQVSGNASASTSVGLYLLSQPSAQSIISIASSGAVSY